MKRRTVLAAMALLLAGPGSSWAGSARERLVVSTDWLARRLGDKDLVILQVGDKAGYEAGHIPGARLVSLADLSASPSGPESLTLQMPDPAALRARLSSLGVSDRSRIVIVPAREGIQSATRAVFVLDAAGLGGRTVLLEGGALAWAAEQRPVTTDVPAVTPGKIAPLKMRPLVADADFVRSHAGAPGYRVVDARAPEFYSGVRTGGSPARPHAIGHIAGAVSVPFVTVTTPDLKLAPKEEIAAQFKAAGVKAGDTVIAYCHVGQQATATLFAARSLGLKALLYDGSFEEWSRLGGPVETSK